MAPYLPDAGDLTGLLGLVAALALFLGLGSVAAGARAVVPESRIVAGWGLACLVLTAWGVAGLSSLRVPLLVLGLLALWPVARRLAGGVGIGAGTGLGIAALLSIPYWLVMLPAWPSQVDTWLNLLPNAAYLVDHGMLPRHDRPPAWSFLPVAPYNTQFASFIASVVAGHLVANGMALFNLALLLLAGLLIARVLSPDPDRPPVWAVAAGIALAIPLNPGFVPRTFLSGYGETPLAVTALVAAWLAADVLAAMARRAPAPWVPLALVLAALVNTKQSGIGLLLPVGVSFAVLAVTHPAIGWRRGLGATAAILAPALALWLAWRGYALTAFQAGELRPLPVERWNVPLLPVILAAMARTIVQKATFYLCLLGVLALAVAHWRRAARSNTATRLALIGGIAVLYNGFLLLTYVAHFPPEMAINAHSYFRYSGHLSLLVMAGLALGLRPAAELVVDWLGDRVRQARIGLVALGLIFPVAAVGLLRFDLQVPQPAVFALGPRIAAHLPADARVAVLAPSDPFDAAGSLVRGVLLYLPPRRPALDLLARNRADAATLEDLRAQGAGHAVITCVPPGLPFGAAGQAALLRATADGWALVEAWSWPPIPAKERLGALLERPVFCAS